MLLNENSLGTCGEDEESNPFHVFILKAEEQDRSALSFPRQRGFLFDTDQLDFVYRFLDFLFTFPSAELWG